MRSKQTLYPFFSALQLNQVQYHKAPRSWFHRLNFFIYQKLSHHPLGLLMLHMLLLVASVAFISIMPYSASVPAILSMLYMGLQHHDYAKAKQRQEVYKLKVAATPPNINHPLLKKRKSYTFNHIFSFTKHEGHLWYALRADLLERPNWKILYIDGLQVTPEQFNAMEMIADGQNLMLRVPQIHDDEIYYKKIIGEAQQGPYYVVTNLCEEPQAIRSWFTLPFFNYFKPSQYGQRLRLPKNAQWAMSNAAVFKGEIIDSRGVAHDHLPITIVYEFGQRKMRLHDPYVEEGSVYQLSLPIEFAQAEDIESSASILFLSKNPKNKNTPPKLHSLYLDYDSEGLHPLIACSFDNQDRQKRLIPINQIQKHRLPVALTEITNITALQCSTRPHTVEIRLGVKDSDNFYFKELHDQNWFYYDVISNVSTLVDELHSICKKSKGTVSTCNTLFTLNQHEIEQVAVRDFHPEKTFCPVLFSERTKQNHLILRRYKSMVRSFLGLESESWSLNPDPQYPNETLLGDEKVVPIQLSVQDDIIQLSDDKGRFDLRLKTKPA